MAKVTEVNTYDDSGKTFQFVPISVADKGITTWTCEEEGIPLSVVPTLSVSVSRAGPKSSVHRTKIRLTRPIEQPLPVFPLVPTLSFSQQASAGGSLPPAPSSGSSGVGTPGHTGVAVRTGYIELTITSAKTSNQVERKDLLALLLSAIQNPILIDALRNVSVIY